MSPISRPLLPLLTACLLALSACGGSDDPLVSRNLDGAYEVIDGGMSYTQVRAIVGYDPTRSQAEGASDRLYIWEADRGTFRASSLLVTVGSGNEGVVRKVLTGYQGNKSQSYR